MTFGRLVLAAATNDALPEARGTRFPPRQMAQSLIRYYMDNIFILYPFFSETSLLTALDNYYQEDRRHIKSSEHWLLYMVLAIASTAQSRSNKDDFYSQGVEFVGRAMDYADRALMPGYSTQIQSLILLTLYSVIDPAHFDSWLLIGFTCRAIVDLGLHQDPAPTQQADKTALDMRRKTFYCAFSLDRYAFFFFFYGGHDTLSHQHLLTRANRAISMIHARGVSFTDDSINVALPSSSGFGPIPAPKSGAGMTGPQPADPALLLFQLRRLQSEWYQRLFQANPAETLPDATAYVWQMCHEMRKWAEATMVNPNLPPAVRERFDLELRYSYVYCLAPSARTPHVTAYGRALIFEHAIAYVDRAFELVHSAAATAFYTYHDALRVYFMGSQFVAVLRDASDALLAADAALLVPLAVPGKAPPPSLPPRLADDLSDNLDRSLRCLGRVALTLEKYGERWSDALSLMQSFDLQSSELVRFLEARKAAASAARQQQPPPQTGLPPRVPVPMAPNQGLPMMVPVSIPMSVPPPPQQVLARGAMPMQFQSQRGEMTWADVDIDRIIRGSM